MRFSKKIIITNLRDGLFMIWCFNRLNTNFSCILMNSTEVTENVISGTALKRSTRLLEVQQLGFASFGWCRTKFRTLSLFAQFLHFAAVFLLNTVWQHCVIFEFGHISGLDRSSNNALSLLFEDYSVLAIVAAWSDCNITDCSNQLEFSSWKHS